MIPFVKLANDLYSGAYFPGAQLRATRAKMQEGGRLGSGSDCDTMIDPSSGNPTDQELGCHC
jgi:hypothetical protein